MDKLTMIKLEKILHVLKRVSLFALTFCLIYACTSIQRNDNENQASHNFPSPKVKVDIFAELTPEQEAAFDALNSIQVQGDHLYSTFAGLKHDCFPPDTSFLISRAELLVAMEELLARHYTSISPEQRKKLSAEAVLSQEEYVVLLCRGYSDEPATQATKAVPASGSWILPKILGRRDIIIEW